MLLDTGGDCELPCRKAIERKSMENLLQVLKEATLFILTTQLFRHLLPGKKYLPYENVILSMAVLSMLIVPILSVADADLPGEFGERVALLETENEMFSQHLEKLEEQETGLFRNNMADSIEARVQKEAEAAGVRVKGVRLLEDGTVFISVSGQKHAEGRAGGGCARSEQRRRGRAGLRHIGRAGQTGREHQSSAGTVCPGGRGSFKRHCAGGFKGAVCRCDWNRSDPAGGGRS